MLSSRYSNLTSTTGTVVVDYVIHFLQHFDPRTQRTSFASIEIHIVPKVSSDNDSVTMYRVFSHTGQLEKKDAMV